MRSSDNVLESSAKSAMTSVLQSTQRCLQSYSPSSQLIDQLITICRLHIPTLVVQIAQIMRNVLPIKLPHVEAIAQESKSILIPVLNLIILVPRPFQQMQEMQP